MRSPSQPETSRAEQRSPGADLWIKVFLQRGEGGHAVLGSSQDEYLRLAADMVLDFLTSQVAGATKVEPDEIVAKPADLEEAVAIFFRLRSLVRGFASDPRGEQVHVVCALENARDFEGKRSAGGMSLRPPLGAAWGQDACEVLWSSPSVFEAVVAQPELGFAKPATGNLDLRRAEGMGRWQQLVPAGVPGIEEAVSLEVTPKAAKALPRFRFGDTGDCIALWLLRHLQPRWVLGSVGALLAVLLVVLLVALHKPRKKQDGLAHTQPPASVRPGAQPGAVLPPVTAPVVTASAVGSGTTKVGRPPASPPAPRGGTKVEAAARASNESNDQEEEGLKQRRSGIDYSQAELRTLILKADRLAGDGDYDQAISLYELVLRKDPKDAEARRGLARARENRADKKD